MMPQAPNARSGSSQPSRRLESFIATSEKAKEAQEKAQQVFLGLIEGPIAPEIFSEQVQWMNPETYDDVTRERAISGMCGYPMCGQTFTDNFGDQTYIIRNNKVYDITERRNYCSEVCYEASELVRCQVSTVPLYLRDTDETPLPNVKLPPRQQLMGRYGKLVNITGGLIDLEEDKPKKKKVFKSVDDIARESLITWSESETDNSSEGERDPQKMRCKERKKAKEKLDIIEEDETGVDGEVNEESEDRRASTEIDKSKQKRRGNQGTSSINCGPRKIKTMSSEKDFNGTSLDEIDEESERERKHEQPDPLLLVYEVEKALREWISFDSLRFILGDKYVRGMLEHIGATWDDYDTTAGLKLGMEAKGKYIALCRKLSHEERSEEAEIKDTLESDSRDGEESVPQRPLPNYQKLQEDAKKQELKVVSFLGGQDQYEEMVREEGGEKCQLETIPEENVSKHGSNTISTSTVSKPKLRKRSPIPKNSTSRGATENEDEDGWTVPFVDSYCQAAWRQHIVLEKLSSYMANGVAVMKLDSVEMQRVLRGLVTTLDLSPHNITFKPSQWRLVTFIIFHMLTVRYPAIHMALRSSEGHLIQTEVTSGLGLDVGYWDRVMTYLTEIRYIINKNLGQEEKGTTPDKSSKVGEECASSERKGHVQDRNTDLYRKGSAGFGVQEMDTSEHEEETQAENELQESGVVKMVTGSIDGQCLRKLTLD